MTQITLQAAEKKWAEILQKALNGEETIIERDGKPVARVLPYKAEGRLVWNGRGQRLDS